MDWKDVGAFQNISMVPKREEEIKITRRRLRFMQKKQRKMYFFYFLDFPSAFFGKKECFHLFFEKEKRKTRNCTP